MVVRLRLRSTMRDSLLGSRWARMQDLSEAHICRLPRIATGSNASQSKKKRHAVQSPGCPVIVARMRPLTGSIGDGCVGDVQWEILSRISRAVLTTSFPPGRL
jgi:hypothetical protein